MSSTSDVRMQADESVSLRASIGTLVVLGLRDIRMAASPTTAYLMVGGQCSSDCAYCGQGRGAIGDHSRLSRISWSEVGEEELVDALFAHPEAFQRVCLQTTASRGVLEQLLALVPRIRQASEVPMLEVPMIRLPPVRHRVTARQQPSHTANRLEVALMALRAAGTAPWCSCPAPPAGRGARWCRAHRA